MLGIRRQLRDGHCALTFRQMSPVDVRRQDVGDRVRAVQFLYARFNSRALTGFAAVATINQQTILNDDWMEQAVDFDVFGQLVDLIV